MARKSIPITFRIGVYVGKFKIINFKNIGTNDKYMRV